jgi:hypothetical protein
LAELTFGAEKSTNVYKNLKLIDTFTEENVQFNKLEKEKNELQDKINAIRITRSFSIFLNYES